MLLFRFFRACLASKNSNNVFSLFGVSKVRSTFYFKKKKKKKKKKKIFLNIFFIIFIFAVGVFAETAFVKVRVCPYFQDASS